MSLFVVAGLAVVLLVWVVWSELARFRGEVKLGAAEMKLKILEEKERGSSSADANSLALEIYCSFCGKQHGTVKKMISGPKVYICNECVDLCNDIIAEEVGPSDTLVRRVREEERSPRREK